jgi:hypothetical protein
MEADYPLPKVVETIDTFRCRDRAGGEERGRDHTRDDRINQSESSISSSMKTSKLTTAVLGDSAREAGRAPGCCINFPTGQKADHRRAEKGVP